MTAQNPQEAQAWRALAALSLGFFMSLLDQSVIALALPSMAKEFEVSADTVTWVSSAYLVALAGPLLVTGRMGDRWGHRRMFLIGVSIFTLAACLAAASPTFECLIAARALMGVGAGVLMPQSMAVINRIFPRHRRGTALGVWGVVGSLAALTGPVLGGAVVGYVGWQGALLMHLPLGVLAVLLAARWVPRLELVDAPVNAVAALSAIVTVAALVAGIQNNSIWLLVVATFAGVVFGLSQRGGEPQALIPAEVLSNRNYVVGTAAITAMGVTAASMLIPLMLWLQSPDGPGISSSMAGLLVIPMPVVGLLLGPVAGWLADKLDPRVLSTSGFGILLAAIVALYFLLSHDGPLWAVSVVMVFLGIGQTGVWATNAATAMRDVSPAVMGAASGLYNTVRQIGSAVGVAAVSAAMAVGTIASGYLVIAGALACGLILSTAFQPTLNSYTD